ncbi:MAG TPA: carboxypeptidase-like regulatory domain-containing protein [Salinivirgaceae bacterium]|nr:carboxypeptidase-like regulatory domain-containing protein [Salinivirgaceae bacterium]
MRISVFALTLFAVSFFQMDAFSQLTIKGRVVAEQSLEALPFVSIQIKNTSFGTISSDEGLFSLFVESKNIGDSVIFSFMGFESKTVAIQDFRKISVIKLKPASIMLDEVKVVGKEPNLIYKNFYSIVDGYRKSKSGYFGKTFFSLSSFNGVMPVEIIEGLYNCEYTDNSGIASANLKMGRYGHDSNSYFYSLNTSDILINYKLYNTDDNTYLPLWPGKMSLNSIKKNYTVTARTDGTNNYIVYTFKAKDKNLFSGSLTFDRATKKIVKVDLLIEKPQKSVFAPINPQHRLELLSIDIQIVYNPQNLQHIKYITVNYDIDYFSSEQTMNINTKALFLLFHEGASYIDPIFTTDPCLSNDYERILAVGFDSVFWKTNYNLPLSDKTVSAFDYLVKHGSTVNFETNQEFKIEDKEHFNLMPWSEHQRIGWNDFNHNSKDFGIREKHINTPNNYYTPADLYNLDFSFMVNPIRTDRESFRYLSNTFFNRKKSYYFLEKDEKTLALVNILFDMNSVEKNTMDSLLMVDNTVFNREIVEQAHINANNNTISIIKHTDRGRDFEKLKEINRTYLQKTGIDNISLYANKYREVTLDNETSADSDYNIGTALLLKKDYIGAILHLTKALEASTNNSQKRDIYYNRAVAFIELNDIPKARQDLQNAINLGDTESQKLLDEINNR